MAAASHRRRAGCVAPLTCKRELHRPGAGQDPRRLPVIPTCRRRHPLLAGWWIVLAQNVAPKHFHARESLRAERRRQQMIASARGLAFDLQRRGRLAGPAATTAASGGLMTAGGRRRVGHGHGYEVTVSSFSTTQRLPGGELRLTSWRRSSAKTELHRREMLHQNFFAPGATFPAMAGRHSRSRGDELLQRPSGPEAADPPPRRAQPCRSAPQDQACTNEGSAQVPRRPERRPWASKVRLRRRCGTTDNLEATRLARSAARRSALPLRTALLTLPSRLDVGVHGCRSTRLSIGVTPAVPRLSLRNSTVTYQSTATAAPYPSTRSEP